MADDTRNSAIKEDLSREALTVDPSQKAFTGAQWQDGKAQGYQPPQNANLMAGGTENTAGGQTKEIGLGDAIEAIKLEDFTVIHKKPCVRDALMRTSHTIFKTSTTMPHAVEFTPETYPPFPTSPDFKTVNLETISLVKLLSQDTKEQDRVFEACKARGFFYLELGGCESGETILKGADDICHMAEDFFKLPLADKEAQRMQEGQLDGYKRVGASVTDKSGTKDTAEFFNIAKNDLTLPPSTPASTMSRQWPPLIMQHQPLLNTYMRTAHSTGLLILSLLATRLGIQPNDITSRHRLEEKSGDLVRLTRGPPRANPEMPEIQTPSHTDFGSITLLMNWLGGLQVWSDSARKAGPLEPDTEGEWLWVKPKKGCAIVNLGDAMVRFTNGALCSGRHRVVPAPGEQGVWPRFSIVYFVRPESQCILGRLEGEGVPPLKEGEEEEPMTAGEWIVKQSKGLGIKFSDN